MNVPLLDPTRRWECPSCGLQAVTKRPFRPNEAEMHNCRALAGLTAPMVPVNGLELRKHSTRHVVVERGDWIGAERGVMRDGEGRAVMAVRTERADGSNDCTVFAPIAVARFREGELDG